MKSNSEFQDALEFVKNEKLSKENERVFGFEGEDLDLFLLWSCIHGYLFLDSCKTGVKGIGIAYPVDKTFDNSERWFYSFNPPKNEKNSDICIMDFLAKTNESKFKIYKKFTERFPNWENQNKYALIRGVPRKISNKFINKFIKITNGK
jgi:hypothetical protein